MNFRQLDSVLPEDLADKVARIVHRDGMAAVLPSVASVIRQLLPDGPDGFASSLRELYPGLKTYVDEHHDWAIVFVFLNDVDVIMFHSYYDIKVPEFYLCEATLRDKIFTVKFALSNMEADEEAEYLYHNRIPLGFLAEKLGITGKITPRSRATIAPAPKLTNDKWHAFEQSMLRTFPATV